MCAFVLVAQTCPTLLRAPWTVTHQGLPSVEFSWQEYWSVLSFPSPGNLPREFASDSKSIWLQCKRPRFNLCVMKIPWRRKWQPIPVLFSGESHGQRSLVGYSPWSHKELDTTKCLHFLVLFKRI